MGLFSRKKEAKKEEKMAVKTVQVKVGEKTEPSKKSMRELYEETSADSVSPKKFEKVKKAEEGGEEKRRFSQAYKILLKPLVTEKAANLGVLDKYVFAVAPRANKIEIAKAIEEVYGLKPVSISIIKVRGKIVRRGRTLGKRKDWKKAIVTLAEGKSIKVYEGV